MNPLPPLLLKGDALTELARIPDDSIDSIVTDPPYGLANTDPAHVVEALTKWAAGDREFIPEGRGFMGKAWDAFVPPPAVWDECLRVLKPGGHLLAFAGSRTFDLMALSIRFAGFDIRDSIAWLYGSGFPKSMDVSKAIDKAAGAEREVVGPSRFAGRGASGMSAENGWNAGPLSNPERPDVTAPATDAAREWEGWGTALKPAFEPIVVARKPFPGTVAANVLAHGTGALNIDATRVGAEERPKMIRTETVTAASSMAGISTGSTSSGETTSQGRWPANVILDESQAAELDRQAPATGASAPVRGTEQSAASNGSVTGERARVPGIFDADIGGASRFFYVAKAPKSERPVVDGVAHPTVKPLALMRQLVKLVTPPEGVLLEPFAGSGTTLEAAYLEGFESIGIEMTPDYWPLIQARIERITS